MAPRIHTTLALAILLAGGTVAAGEAVIDNEDVRRRAEDLGRVAAEARDTGLDIAGQAVDLADEVSEAFTEGYRDAERRP